MVLCMGRSLTVPCTRRTNAIMHGNDAHGPVHGKDVHGPVNRKENHGPMHGGNSRSEGRS